MPQPIYEAEIAHNLDGHRWDLEIGLFYCYARYYNLTIGYFIQTDPIGYATRIDW